MLPAGSRVLAERGGGEGGAVSEARGGCFRKSAESHQIQNSQIVSGQRDRCILLEADNGTAV